MLLLKVQTLNWELSSWSQTNTHRCFSAYVTLGKRLSLLWAECSHQTTPPLWCCRHRFRLRQGYHVVSDMLADTSTLLTVISTSLCCPQDARCQANDPDRVQQALTPPKQTRFRGLNDAQHSLNTPLGLPPIHGIDRSACFRYQCVTRNKKPRNPPVFSYFWFNPVSVGGKASYTFSEQSLNNQWTSLAF